MGKLFGTDGIRGVVGKTLTAELAFHVGQAVAVVLQEELGRRPLITIGKDTRVSSDMLEAALTAGICSVGGDVLLLGVIPTPAVAFLTVQEKADAGVVISASHNPYEYNGIKVFNAQGYKLPDAMEERVEELILNHAALPVKSGGELGRCRNGAQEMHDDYVSHLMDTIGCDLSGLRVMVDCANGAAAATVNLAQFAGLPYNLFFVEQLPNRSHKFSGGIRCARLASCTCELCHANTMIQVSTVVAFHYIWECWVKCCVDICGEALRCVKYMSALCTETICQIFNEVLQIRGA